MERYWTESTKQLQKTMKQTLSIKQLACQNLQTRIDRSSRSQIFFKIGVLKNFAKFTRKQPCWSLFLITLQVWKPATLLKGDPTPVFSCEYGEFLRKAVFIEYLWWLRLNRRFCLYRKCLFSPSPLPVKKIIKQDNCIPQWCHYYGLLILYSVTKIECLRAVIKDFKF